MKKFIIKSIIFTVIFFSGGIGAILFINARGSAPNDLQSSAGDKITSSKWNQLVGNTIKTYGGKSTTSNGLYCGSTASSYDGAGVGGYAGAKTKCETACGDGLAHMCDAKELITSKSLGVSTPDLNRFSNFSRGYRSTIVINDCVGWTNNTSTYAGPVTRSANPTTWPCNNTYPIACCK